MYGPYHNITNLKHQEVRVLPKLVSMVIKDMFRYQACRFKNLTYKENCARIFCEKEMQIAFAYCLEVSQQGFYCTVPGRGR